MVDGAPAKGSEKEEKRKKKRQSRGRKLITSDKIFGKVPRWALALVGSGVGILLCMNLYLALNMDERKMSSSLMRKIWEATRKRMHQVSNIKKGCPYFGCSITPPEWISPKVQKDLETVDVTPVTYGTWKMATLTRRSNRVNPPFNQDRGTIIQPYLFGQKSDFFIGIFDGHGAEGHVNAQYFVKDVPERLAKKLDRDSLSSSTTKLSLVDIDKIQQHLIDAFVESDAQAPRNMTLRGGCTASVTLRIGNLLFFANTGDSYTMLVSVNKPKFHVVEQGPAPGVITRYTTKADKPHLPKENARILKAGGRVHIPPQAPMQSRVIVDSTVFNESIGLAMSRSLGDYEWTVKGVIPDPTVDVVDIDTLPDTYPPETSVFVIAASDGLWDRRMQQWFAKQFAESFLKGGDPRKIHPLTKMSDIINFISPEKEGFYRDDITAITMQVL